MGTNGATNGIAIAGLIMALLGLVVNVLMLWRMTLLTINARQQENREAELKRSNELAIEQKITIATSDHKAKVEMLHQFVGQIQLQMQKGETAFRILREEDNKLRLEVLERIGRLATKEDLKELESRLDRGSDD